MHLITYLIERELKKAKIDILTMQAGSGQFLSTNTQPNLHYTMSWATTYQILGYTCTWINLRYRPICYYQFGYELSGYHSELVSGHS